MIFRRYGWVELAHLLSAIFLCLILSSNFWAPQLMEQSDYLMTFYVAGDLAATGELERLYPDPERGSFRDSPFDQAAHQLLPNLPEDSISTFMYSPLVAWIFTPLSFPDPSLSLFVWQILSTVALALACTLLARASMARPRELFFLSFFYFPAFSTVWIGQVGIVFGLLPLSAGYLFLRRGRHILAGLIWSVLALKPQFLPVAALVAVAFVIVKKYHCLLGMALGTSIFLAVNLLVAPASILMDWLVSFRVSEQMFSSGLYEFPEHLNTSLPLSLLMLFPASGQEAGKLVVYGLVLGLGVVALWQSRKILISNLPEASKTALVFGVAIGLLPLTSPHLLYYDLVMLLPTGVILLDEIWRRPPYNALRKLVILAWASISTYLVLVLAIDTSSGMPLALTLILLALWVGLLRVTNELSRADGSSRLAALGS